MPHGSQFIETESRMVGRQWSKVGRGSWCSVGAECQFCWMKKVLEVDGGDGYTITWLYVMLLNWTLKMIKMVRLFW